MTWAKPVPPWGSKDGEEMKTQVTLGRLGNWHTACLALCQLEIFRINADGTIPITQVFISKIEGKPSLSLKKSVLLNWFGMTRGTSKLELIETDLLRVHTMYLEVP